MLEVITGLTPKAVCASDLSRKTHVIKVYLDFLRYRYPSHIYIDQTGGQKIGVPRVEVLMAFVAQLVLMKYQPANIDYHLSNVSRWFLQHTGIDPRLEPETQKTYPSLQQLVQGIRKTLGTAVKVKVPVTPPMLRQMLGKLSGLTSNLVEQAMYLAALVVMLFGLMRGGTVMCKLVGKFDPTTELKKKDVTFRFNASNEVTSVGIFVKKRKTDQEKNGTVVYLPRTGDALLCPVLALYRFYCLTKNQPSEGAFFTYQNRNLTPGRLGIVIKHLAAKAGITKHLTPHCMGSAVQLPWPLLDSRKSKSVWPEGGGLIVTERTHKGKPCGSRVQ